MEQTKMLVYSTVTLLGVVVASAIKGYIEGMGKLTMLLVGTALAVFVAHAWAGTLAEGMKEPGWPAFKLLPTELKTASLTFIPVAVGAVFGWVTYLISGSYEAGGTATAAGLALLLTAATVVSALRHKKTPGEIVAWSAASAVVGVLAVILKLIVD